MEFFTWNENFSVGINTIDEQHKKLVSLINELATAMSEGKGRDKIDSLLTELADYTVYHFSEEEKLMANYEYPGLEEHKKIHSAFVEKVSDFKKKYENGSLLISIEVFQFLQDWLKEHILGTDKQYSPFLREKGVK